MKLYLSSARVAVAPPELKTLAANARVGIVMNALDGMLDIRKVRLPEQVSVFQDLASSVKELDLRSWFNAPEKLLRTLQQLDLVWVNGGNTFVLRRAMFASGFDGIIKELLATDQIAYAGFSAGTTVLGPTLRGLEIDDDHLEVPEGYPQDIIWDGLGILPHAVIVHHNAGRPGDSGADHEMEFYKRRGIPYRTLQDGEALVVDGDIGTLKLTKSL